MEIEIKKYLFDIQQACELVAEFTIGQDFEAYQINKMMQSAVERQFITIGEALNQILKRKPELEAEITKARKIVDFRNVLRGCLKSPQGRVCLPQVPRDRYDRISISPIAIVSTGGFWDLERRF